VLDDLEPSAIASGGGRSQETIANIGRRWWKARDELLVFGTTDPSGEVALAANSLADSVAATWTSVVRLNHEPGSAENLQAAATDHRAARAAADALGELLRRRDGSPSMFRNQQPR
jgi:hypothetical protein